MRNHTYIDTNATSAVGHGKRGFASIDLMSSSSDDSEIGGGIAMIGRSRNDAIKLESDDETNNSRKKTRTKLGTERVIKSEDDMTERGYESVEDDSDHGNDRGKTRMPTPAMTPTPKKTSHSKNKTKPTNRNRNRGYRIKMTQAAGDVFESINGSGSESEATFTQLRTMSPLLVLQSTTPSKTLPHQNRPGNPSPRIPEPPIQIIMSL